MDACIFLSFHDMHHSTIDFRRSMWRAMFLNLMTIHAEAFRSVISHRLAVKLNGLALCYDVCLSDCRLSVRK